MPNDIVTGQCIECGGNPVNHTTEWISALFESVMTPIGMGIDTATAGIRSFLFHPQSADMFALPLFRVLSAIGLGSITEAVDEHDSGRNRWLWDSAKHRGITMYEFRVLGHPDGMNLFVAKLGNKTIAFEGLPRPSRRVSVALNWMDNKAVMKQKFLAAGIPVARGGACSTYAQALRIFKEVGGPVIIKPHIGSHGRHTTIHINDAETLRTAFLSAKRLSPWVIVERELQGRVFRVLLVQEKMAAIVRREEPHVVGDGVSTIRELVEKENKNPKRQGPTFYKLHTDAESEEELARQGFDWNSIPPAGTIASLNTHVGRFYGASTTDFTERVHPDNVKLFEYVGKTLGDSLVGLDFIIEDMARSWHDQPLSGIIECNSLPSVDLHHDVLYGKNRDAAGLLLDIAFKTSADPFEIYFQK